MTRLSSGALCSKWLSPPKRFFGVFPKQFFTSVSQTPAVFWATGSCFRKGSVEGSANYSLHLSPKWLLLHKSSLEGSANCALSLLLGYSLGLFFTRIFLKNHLRSAVIRIPPLRIVQDRCERGAKDAKRFRGA